MAERKKKLKWAPTARVQLRSVLDFYTDRNQSPDYSRSLLKRLENKLERIREFPELCEKVENGTSRFFPIDNFVVFYEQLDELILVQAFRDARRQPED